MIAFKLISALIGPTLLGAGIVRYYHRNAEFPVYLYPAVGLGLGFGILTQWMLLLSVVHLRFTFLTLEAPLIGTTLFFWLRARRGEKHLSSATHPAETSDSLRPCGILEKVIKAGLLFYIAYILTFVCLRAVMVPILEWDAISWIALKGKIFFSEKRVFQPQFLPNSAYPLHINLCLAWIAYNLGSWSETLVKIVFPAYFIAYSLIHYNVVRMYLTKNWALASLALLVSANFFNYHATIAYRDIILMYYFCTAILLVVMWVKTQQDFLLVLGSLFLGFCSFVKLEGVLYAGIGLIVLATAYLTFSTAGRRATYFKLLSLCVPAAAIFIFFYMYKNLIGAVSSSQDLSMIFSVEVFPRLCNVLKAFGKELFLSPHWHLIWLLLALSLGQIKRITETFELRLTGGAIVLFFMLYIGMGSMTGIYKSILGLGSSSVLSRIVLHVYPLSVFFIALANGEWRYSRQDGPRR